MGKLGLHGDLFQGKGAPQVPRLPPYFLSILGSSTELIPLSLLKAAYVAVYERCVVGNPEFARDDKGKGGASIEVWLLGLEELWVRFATIRIWRSGPGRLGR